MQKTLAIVLPLLAATAWAQPADKARSFQPEVDAMKEKTARATQLATAVEKGMREAGFEEDERSGQRAFKVGKSEPTPDAVARVEALIKEVKEEAGPFRDACDAFFNKANQLELVGGETPTWEVYRACNQAANALAQLKAGSTRALEDWRAQREKREAAEAVERAYLEPVSGNDPRQRAVPLPRSVVTRNGGDGGSIVDGLALFRDAHPSHFLFLRHDVREAPPPGGTALRPLPRTLHKGEAVIGLIDAAGVFLRNQIQVVTIDGIKAVVEADALAVVPIGGKPGALKPEDLVIRDAEGIPLGGPAWVAPDATGFSLDEEPRFLALLDPPEPRTQRFIEAREKIRTCYRNKMKALDPSGRFRKYYDVVTYGRGGIKSVESAAVNFDRKVCAACGCKKFNDSKRKLITQAIHPAQQEQFQRYKPVLEKLNTTDFVRAAQGAPAGHVEQHQEF